MINLSSTDDARSDFKKQILDQLREKGLSQADLETVEMVLDGASLDNLFVKASGLLTVTSPAVAVRGWEAYFGSAAEAFASREKKQAGVDIHGPVQAGVIVGGNLQGDSIVAQGNAVVSAIDSTCVIILEDLRAKGIDVAEGERSLAELKDAPTAEKEGILRRFASWAKNHASYLTANGLAALSVILQFLKGG